MHFGPYGEPFGIPAGDVDFDGWASPANASLISAWSSIPGWSYQAYADIDLDGDIDSADASATTAETLGRGDLTFVGSTVAYAGYVQDAYVPTVSHVRYRVYKSDLGRWLQRDPAGYVDEASLYEYAMSAPVTAVDSLGLRTIVNPGVRPLFPSYPGVPPRHLEPRTKPRNRIWPIRHVDPDPYYPVLIPLKLAPPPGTPDGMYDPTKPWPGHPLPYFAPPFPGFVPESEPGPAAIPGCGHQTLPGAPDPMTAPNGPVPLRFTDPYPLVPPAKLHPDPPIKSPRNWRQCPDGLLDLLTSLMKEACGGARSCPKATQQSCATLTPDEVWRRLRQGKLCLDLRKQIMDQCFYGGDKQHHDHYNQELVPWSRCNDFWEECWEHHWGRSGRDAPSGRSSGGSRSIASD